MANLAIIIPAYKIVYFEQVLESISNQTCKDFTVYIGNDGSHDNFNPLIEAYISKIPIVYKYFSENIGGNDLVAHWERCIDLVKDEEWLWLFSDDDVMETTCVENFYKSLAENTDTDLFHFNVSRINEHNEVIEDCFLFPEILQSENFLISRLKGTLSSSVVEYIFRKEYFMQQKRFQKFDLAWGSDDATWIKLGKRKGIRTIHNSIIFWRKSPFNISPNDKDINIVQKKIYAQIQFSKWIMEKENLGEIQINNSMLKSALEAWFLEKLKLFLPLLTYKSIAKILNDFHATLNGTRNRTKKIASLFIYKIYRSLMDQLKEFLLKRKPITKNLSIDC